MKTKHTGRLIVFLLALVMVVGLLPTGLFSLTAFAVSGNGTENDPYLISTYDELKRYLNYGNGTYYLKLNADIIQNDSINMNEITMTKNTTIYFDFAGHKIVRNATTVDNYMISLSYPNAELIINDSVGGGQIECNYGTPIYALYGTLIINGGTFLSTSNKFAGHNYGIELNGDINVTINGGTFKSTYGDALRSSSGTLTVNGGNFYTKEDNESGSSMALYLSSNNGNFTINECNVYGNSTNTGAPILIAGIGNSSSKYLDGHIPATSTVKIDGVIYSHTDLHVSDLKGNEIIITGQKTPISTVNLTGLEKPIADQPADFTADEAVAYSVSDISWYDRYEEMNLAADELVTGNRTLRCTFKLKAKQGYKFNADTEVEVPVHNYYDLSTSLSGDNLFVTFYVWIDYSYVKEFNIINLSPPVAGQHPDFTADSAGGKLNVTSVEWVQQFDDFLTLTADDTFEVGKDYQCFIYFEGNEDAGYLLANTGLTATINGISVAPSYKISHTAGENTASVYEIYTTTATELTSVSATVTAPVAGAHPNFTAASGDSDKYTTTVKYWIDKDNNHMTSADTFVAGQKYLAFVEFSTKAGFTFSSSLAGSINSQDTASTGTANPDRRLLWVEFTVPAAAVTELTSVSATVTAPVAGETPSATFTSGEPDKYSVAAYKWYKGGSVSAPGTAMNAGDKFEAGEIYILTLYFEPKAGYTMGSTTAATINSNSTYYAGSIEGTYCYRVAFTVPAAHTHSYTGAWKSDAANHWQLCSCGDTGNTAAHAYGAWTVTKAATETATGSRERTCAVCGYKQTEVIPMLSHTHAYGTEWKNDDSQHWHECDCGDKSDLAAHTFGEWTVTKEATEAEEGLKNRTCSACGYVESLVIPVLGHEHSYTEEWKSDAANHWNECDCGEKSNQAAHTFGEWETVKEATATEEGSRKRACSVCGYEEYEAIPVIGSESTDTSEPATSEPTPTDPEKPGETFLWWIIVVGLVAVGGITAVVIIVVRKNKNKTKEN